MREGIKLIYLVSCTAKKRPGRLPAKEKYMASPWFCAARALAEAKGDEWYILSAKHGLIFPDDEIDDYDLSLTKMNPDRREVWANWVFGDLYYSGADVIVILAGKLYRQHLAPMLREIGMEVKEPLAHIPGAQRQIQWLQQALVSQD